MSGWFTQNTDYLVFLALVAGLWLLLAVDRAGRNAQNAIRRQVQLPGIMADVAQIGQVLFNIVQNAAAALGIMRSHPGALRLVSEPGSGAAFTWASPATGRPAPTAAARSWRGSGTVLIVDDEEAVRATAAQMIAFFGFTVKQAGSGQQAIDLLRQHDSRFDLVLLDLTMPGMDGYTTFTALRQLQPDQRIVVFSGYSAEDAKQRFAGQHLNGFLQKPFGTDSLRAVLREATLS